jgi:hypothetical protein
MVSRVFFIAGVLMALCASLVDAQTRATTEDGKSIIVYPNGTWRHAAGTPQPKDLVYAKPDTARQAYDARRGGFQVWYDSDKWKPGKPAKQDIETLFNHVSGELWAMVISERIPVPLATLRDAAVANAQDADPNVKVALEERRRVNGLDVIVLQLEGVVQGIPFTYHGYFYSTTSGTIQVIAFTPQSMFSEYRDEITRFLNGLTLRPQ